MNEQDKQTVDLLRRYLDSVIRELETLNLRDVVCVFIDGFYGLEWNSLTKQISTRGFRATYCLPTMWDALFTPSTHVGLDIIEMIPPFLAACRRISDKAATAKNKWTERARELAITLPQSKEDELSRRIQA